MERTYRGGGWGTLVGGGPDPRLGDLEGEECNGEQEYYTYSRLHVHDPSTPRRHQTDLRVSCLLSHFLAHIFNILLISYSVIFLKGCDLDGRSMQDLVQSF